jgi:hypothetical protein
MAWDDELESLKAQVVDRFGWNAFDAAFRRASVVMLGQARSIAEASHAGANPRLMAVRDDALRLELRRLLDEKGGA